MTTKYEYRLLVWSKLIQPVLPQAERRNNFAQELDHTNKMAVIFHEVLAAITKSQGDVTTKRARKANAHLFMGSREKLRKSYEIMFPKYVLRWIDNYMGQVLKRITLPILSLIVSKVRPGRPNSTQLPRLSCKAHS